MTFHESRAAVTAALASGADGCLSKSSVSERLLQTIEGLLGPEIGKQPRWTNGEEGER